MFPKYKCKCNSQFFPNIGKNHKAPLVAARSGYLLGLRWRIECLAPPRTGILGHVVEPYHIEEKALIYFRSTAGRQIAFGFVLPQIFLLDAFSVDLAISKAKTLFLPAPGSHYSSAQQRRAT